MRLGGEACDQEEDGCSIIHSNIVPGPMVQRGSTCSGEKIKETPFHAAQDHGRLANAGTIADMYEICQVTTQAWDGKVKGAASQLQ